MSSTSPNFNKQYPYSPISKQSNWEKIFCSVRVSVPRASTTVTSFCNRSQRLCSTPSSSDSGSHYVEYLSRNGTLAMVNNWLDRSEEGGALACVFTASMGTVRRAEGSKATTGWRINENAIDTSYQWPWYGILMKDGCRVLRWKLWKLQLSCLCTLQWHILWMCVLWVIGLWGKF